MAVQSTIATSAAALGILAAGFLAAQLTTTLLLRVYRTQHKIVSIRTDRKIKALRYFLMTLTIMGALVYLRRGVVAGVLSSTVSVLPNVLTAILLLTLGMIVVNVGIKTLERVLRILGFLDYAAAYGTRQTLRLAMFAVRGFLYLVVIETVIAVLGLGSAVLTTAVQFVVFAIVVAAALLGFVVFRPYMENMAASQYMKSQAYFKKGQRVRLGSDAGEIATISGVHTILALDSGNMRIIPNRELLRMDLQFEVPKTRTRTLEEIKNHFVAQKPSHCGPAAMQMALSMFGMSFTQEEIATLAGTKVGTGTHPQILKSVVEQLTERRVLGHWISVEKIIDLKQELKAWLHDGALVIMDFKKNIVFPSLPTEKAHYTLCVGIEGDDLLILDPSKSQGGVYLVNHKDMYKGMNTYSKLIEGKRGYLILAPTGTPAYWRVKEGLVYSDKDVYERLSKNIERKLDTMLDKSKLLRNVFPDSVQQYLNEWEERYKVARLWRPEEPPTS